MSKGHILLLVSGLGLLMMLGSLALAQEPVSEEDVVVPAGTPVVHVERREPLSLSEGQVISRAVSIEPVQLQIAEQVTIEARMPITQALLPTGREVGRYDAIQPVRCKFRALTRQAVDEAYPITLSVPNHDSGSSEVRPAAVCTVNSIDDSGPGTLRQCLEDAVPGDTITFDAGVFPPINPTTISLSSALPWIITDSLTIDASDAGVILDGSALSNGTGFVVSGADGVKIQGMQIMYFPLHGIAIASGATNTTIGGDRFTGSGPLGQGNLISGNKDDGIHIQDVDTTGNQVLGNLIGTNVSGTAALSNLDKGIVIVLGASNNIIGGTTPGVGNLISGNEVDGILLWGAGTTGNQILGNSIGTDVSGTAMVGNLRNGIFISDASNNVIGGTTPGAGNLISGNEAIGILLQDPDTTGNQVLGNYIGTDVSGTTALGNYQSGIVISFGASNNIVGGTLPGTGNLISGNDYAGIHIQNSGTTGNQVLGNFIGTDASGTMVLGNLQTGVSIIGAPNNNIIGGTAPGAGNLISGNEGSGIWLEGTGTMSNTVQGNFVGTNVSGTVVLGNLDRGVVIYLGASNNTIGGTAPGAGNLVSGNEGGGIWLEGSDTTNNTVQGNFIGTDADGTAALGNLQPGITIGWGASSNIIGGATTSARNLIGGNQHAGIWLGKTGTSDNQILGNFVGTNVDGTAAIGNRLAGVFIGFNASNNVIGGEPPGTGNLISGNEDNGILIWGTGTTGNQVLGNFIGTDKHGTASLGNSPHGIFIDGGTSNNLVGGETIQAGNTIAFNDSDGVRMDGNQTLGNTISHNSVHDNGGLGIELTNGGNGEPPPPTITTVISTSVSGQTQPGHIVEVFSDNDAEGQWFEGSVTADENGNFTITQPAGFRGPNVTATATDAAGNTSEFFAPPVSTSPRRRVFLPIIIRNSR